MNGLKDSGTHGESPAGRGRIRIGGDKHISASSGMREERCGQQVRCLCIKDDVAIGVAV